MPTVEVRVTADDYLKANLAIRRPKGRTIMMRVAAVLTIIAVGVFLAWRGELHAAIIVACMGFGALGGALLVPLIAGPVKTRRVFTQMVALQRPYQISWDNARFTVTSETSRAEIPWHEFHKAQELPDLFVLFTSDVSMIMVPKRSMPDQQILSSLREHLYAHVKQVSPVRK